MICDFPGWLSINVSGKDVKHDPLINIICYTYIKFLISIPARVTCDGAGVDTPEAIAQWEPETLRMILIEFVARTGFGGITPLPKEVLRTTERLRRLTKIVEQ